MSGNRSGGTGCGWGLGIIAMIAAVVSLGISGGVAVGSVTDGVIGLPSEVADLAGILFLVALVALGMARRGEE